MNLAIILVISLVCLTSKVNAETLMLTSDNISFNNSSNVNYYFNLDPNSTTNVEIEFSYSGNKNYNTLVLDVCSGIPLTNSENLYRSYNAGASCPNSCVSNNIVRKSLGTTCVNSNGYTTNSYRIYLPIVKLDYGAGCGQTGCHPSLKDTITFKNTYSWWTFADINGAYLTDELTDITDNSAINKVDTSINNLNSNLGGKLENVQGSIIEESNQTQDKLDEQTQQDKAQHDEFMNSDISNKDKEMPDDSKYQDYTDTENDLKDKVNEADMSVISIGIDANSSVWVWDTLTRLIQSNSVVFGMFIAILSIGIIKLALGR